MEKQNTDIQPKPAVKPANPGTSKTQKTVGPRDPSDQPKKHWTKRCYIYLHNKDDSTYCGRTCKNWISIIVYSFMYLIFLTTYTMIFLYISLTIIKHTEEFNLSQKIELLTYSENGIGLSAAPTSVNSQPLIWYRDEPGSYQKYIDSLEVLLHRRRKRDISEYTDLGPCGSSPFGYGNNPCVLIRINKQLKWKVKPLKFNSTEVENIPMTVKNWIKNEKPKLWLYCMGYNDYDKEHIGKIKYYPDPPGFDSELFPIDMQSVSPLVAVQFSGFTFGVSVVVKCNLWYEGGVSSTEFVLYVTHKKKNGYDL